MKRTHALARSGFGFLRLSGHSVFRHRRSAIFLLAITLFAARAVFAQTGQNAVIHDTGGHTTNSPSFFDATQFGMTNDDPCKRILATFSDPGFPSTGATVDARGLSGTNTTLICSVNPIPSGAKGRLLLSSGTYLAQVPWVIQSDNFSIIGTGASGDTGNNNTIIQACASGQPNCGGVVFPSGNALIQMGTSAQTVMRSEIKELAVDCQDVPGVSGFQAVNAQEQTVVDLVRATGCRVAAFDIGVGDTNVQNGVALSNFDCRCPTQHAIAHQRTILIDRIYTIR